jgi:hypothetical protein
MNIEETIKQAQHQRNETIREMTYLIKDLQEDLERLIKHKHAPTEEGLTPQSGHRGFYISQHCLRYEQTMKAGWKMEEWARLATWMMTYEKEKGH